MPKITKPCEYCGKEWISEAWKGHEAKFCSNYCRQKSLTESHPEKFPWIKAGKRISQCRHCGKDFWKRHLDKFFCDPKCYAEYRTNQRKKICIQCKNEFITMPKYKPKKQIFCSQSCEDQYWYELKKKNMTRRTQASESIRLFGYACEKCGKEENVDCHHLDCNPKNNPLDGSNWMRLCASCHKITHILGKKRGKFLTRHEIQTKSQ